MGKHTCSVDGCDGRVLAKGLCGKHYRRQQRNGTTELLRKRTYCSIEGCNIRANTDGICSKHLWRLRSNGDPLVSRRIVGDDEARLLMKIDRRGPNECWPWLGGGSGDGYGQIRIKGAARRAHIVMYEMTRGPIPEGFILDHTCHKPSECDGGDTCPHRLCCNPDHVEVTTREHNTSAERMSSFHRRKTHCPQGHEYTTENTIGNKRSGRLCKTCSKKHKAAYRSRRSAVARE
jgi:hypothetical protein